MKQLSLTLMVSQKVWGSAFTFGSLARLECLQYWIEPFLLSPIGWISLGAGKEKGKHSIVFLRAEKPVWWKFVKRISFSSWPCSVFSFLLTLWWINSRRPVSSGTARMAAVLKPWGLSKKADSICLHRERDVHSWQGAVFPLVISTLTDSKK